MDTNIMPILFILFLVIFALRIWAKSSTSKEGKEYADTLVHGLQNIKESDQPDEIKKAKAIELTNEVNK
ncbi:MAG TPA: hypothetical protein VN665_01345 [Candidatus Paceibacterota bacterium]|nr:hypothetical protein [Candidatus Paceibacterota bacterium]